jgi:hypothetical protein
MAERVPSRITIVICAYYPNEYTPLARAIAAESSPN